RGLARGAVSFAVQGHRRAVGGQPSRCPFLIGELKWMPRHSTLLCSASWRCALSLWRCALCRWSPAGGPLLFWGAGGGLLSDQTHPVVRFSQSLQKSLNRAGASAVARPSARRRRRCISVRSVGVLPEIHLQFRRFFRYRTLIVVGGA